jgi:hypothetical protein
MEGYGLYQVQGGCLFFISLNASDDLAKNLRKTAVRVSMRLSSSMEYLMNMPIKQFIEMVEEIIEIDEEDRQRRESRRKK